MNSWEPILEAVGAATAGRSDDAQETLQACWERTQPSDHAERCVIAHYLADQQTDLNLETEWDARALAEHAQVEESAFTALGIDAAAGFAPSLHLNLGDDYLRAGQLEMAREQLAKALAAEHLLPDGGYGAMIRRGIDGLQHRLDALSE
ncbi:hypothetical protein [Branchiibius sp. NY16-3462-2]|uniref:hypothetical protein n=1 Tax=Branchiibius sp. NY16-3462-2 TaxID=1807500 RepID=UPI00079B8BD0|nr:hypothetical protein [Branchiibius sp. NY16-3462-2]KYH45686.1 hypothetical protein AZH51_18415 [Branchiibius sp. NY16-3462-2]